MSAAAGAVATANPENKQAKDNNMNSENKIIKVYARSGIKKETHPVELEWRIENFLSLPSTVKEKTTLKWEIPEKNLKFETAVFPGGEDANSAGFVSIFTWNRNERAMIFTTFEMKVVDSEGQNICHKKAVGRTVLARRGPRESGRGWPECLKRSDIENNPSKYLQDNSLVILVHLNIEDEMDAETSINVLGPEVDEVTGRLVGLNWTQNIRLGFREGLTSTDVSLLCGEDRVKCHKFILGLASDVFRTYFKEENDTLENKTNTITITDASIETVREFIKFIYTNDFRDDFDDMGQLMYLANKYNVESLRVRCEESLVEKVNKDNVAELAVLGKSYNSEKLKDVSVEFIAKHKEVMQSESWSKAVKNDPKAMMEIATEVITKMMPM